MSHDDKEDYRDGSCDEDGSMGKVQQRADAGKRKNNSLLLAKTTFSRTLRTQLFAQGRDDNKLF